MESYFKERENELKMLQEGEDTKNGKNHVKALASNISAGMKKFQKLQAEVMQSNHETERSDTTIEA